MLKRLFETSVEPNACNFFLGLFIHLIYIFYRMWALVVWYLTRDLPPADSKDEFGCTIKKDGILSHKQIFNICATPYQVV